MSKPLQIVINDVALPTTTRDRYQAYEADLREIMTMADGSVAEEIVGTVWRIVYSYDKMPDEAYRAVLAAIRRGGVKTVSFLPDNGTDLLVSEFLVESVTQPSLQFYVNGKPSWHNFGFVLREVRPHA